MKISSKISEFGYKKKKTDIVGRLPVAETCNSNDALN